MSPTLAQLPPLLITAEHADRELPDDVAALFAHADARTALASHRGYDPGTAALARALADHFNAPLLTHAISRLVVDANRSPHNRAIHSDFTRSLSRTHRRALIDAYHTPHWQAVREQLDNLEQQPRVTPVVHIGVHSFTAVLRGRSRNFDVGLLYDPRRPPERELCERWRAALLAADHPWRVRRNAPYRGAADGLVTALRKERNDADYLGIELEINQALVTADGQFPQTLTHDIIQSLDHALHAANDLRP